MIATMNAKPLFRLVDATNESILRLQVAHFALSAHRLDGPAIARDTIEQALAALRVAVAEFKAEV